MTNQDDVYWVFYGYSEPADASFIVTIRISMDRTKCMVELLRSEGKQTYEHVWGDVCDVTTTNTFSTIELDDVKTLEEKIKHKAHEILMDSLL